MTISAAIKVNGGAAGAKAAVAASGAIHAELDDTSGVKACTWTVISTDGVTVPGDYALVVTGPVNNVCDTNATANKGTALLLKARVTDGVNIVEDTVKIYVPCDVNGLEVGCAGEEYESDGTYGSTLLLNAAIRAVGLSWGPWKATCTAATTAALPANTRSGNTLTATGNGALAAQDGVTLTAGETLLVKNEGGGASHAHNGPYVVTDAGSGSTPWILDRHPQTDESSEVYDGMIIVVEQGTTLAGHMFQQVIAGPFTINTTALEFKDQGTLLALVTSSASGTVNQLSGTNATLQTDGSTPGGNWRTQVLYGSTPASGGRLNFTNLDELRWFSTAASSLPVLSLDGSDDIQVGSNTADQNDLHLNVPTGNLVYATVAGANELTVGGGYVGIGDGTLGSSGAMRVEAGFNVVAGASDIALISEISGNTWVGGVYPTRPGDANVDAANNVYLRQAGSQKFQVDSTRCIFWASIAEFQWGVSAPVVRQGATTAAGITGEDCTFKAQDATDPTSDGGATIVQAPAGGNLDGTAEMRDASGNAAVQVDASGNIRLTPQAFTSFNQSGGALPPSGTLRLEHGENLVYCDNAGTGSVAAMSCLAGADQIFIGGPYPTRPTHVNLDGGSVTLRTNGTTRVNVGATYVQFLTSSGIVFDDTTTANPLIEHQTIAAAGVTGGTLTMKGQDASDATSTGGKTVVKAPAGGLANGTAELHDAGGTTRLTVGDNGVDFLEVTPATGYIQVGNAPPGGTDPSASTGRIRLPWQNGGNGIVFRDHSDGGDVAGLSSQTNALWVGGAYPTRPFYVELDASSIVRSKIGGNLRFQVANTIVTVRVATLDFDVSLSSPVLQQATTTSAGITGESLTFKAQDATDATSSGGATIVQAPAGGASNGSAMVRDAGGAPRVTVDDTNLTFGHPATLKSYTVATLPAAASYTAAWIYVTDETGGAVPAFSDGTNWRRCTDRAVVS